MHAKDGTKYLLVQPIRWYLKISFFYFFQKTFNFMKTVQSYIDRSDYSFQGKRLSEEKINQYNQYCETKIPSYMDTQDAVSPEKTSQFFLYKKILEKEPQDKKLRICNIGAFYTLSDVTFLNKRPHCEVFALDFMPMVKHNHKFKDVRNLNLIGDYPLDSLQRIYSGLQNKDEPFFDYVLFTRTATLINSNELFSYFELIKKISKNVLFLEVAEIMLNKNRVLDISKIPIDKPIPAYGSMRIHNYPGILEKFGFEIVDSAIYDGRGDNFEKDFGMTHKWIYFHGKNC
jgi:hypothetical protein